MIADLFAGQETRVALDDGAVLLRGVALAEAEALLDGIARIAAAAPLRHMVTPGGKRMSAAMTNAGRWGWTTGPGGYAYRDRDPVSGLPWPPLPTAFAALAARAAAAAGFPDFTPDGCLINRYDGAAKMGLHQDRDETDLGQPIVSVSLGRSATFLWGGATRTAPRRRYRLDHGDVLVWGGPARLAFHGVDAPEPDSHMLPCRYNLTFRRAR